MIINDLLEKEKKNTHTKIGKYSYNDSLQT